MSRVRLRISRPALGRPPRGTAAQTAPPASRRGKTGPPATASRPGVAGVLPLRRGADCSPSGCADRLSRTPRRRRRERLRTRFGAVACHTAQRSAPSGLPCPARSMRRSVDQGFSSCRRLPGSAEDDFWVQMLHEVTSLPNLQRAWRWVRSNPNPFTSTTSAASIQRSRLPRPNR